MKYESVVKQFLAFSGKRRRKDIAAITSRGVAAFKDHLAGLLSIGAGEGARLPGPFEPTIKKRRGGQLGAGSKHARSRLGSVLGVAPNRSS